MNILILPAWYPTEDNPLGGIFFKEQAEALARRGHTVTVAAIHNDGKKGVSCRVKETGNLREYEFHHAPLRFHLTYFRVVRYLAKFIRTEFPTGRPDVIHVHSYRYLKFGAALHVLFRIPLVVTEHASAVERNGFSSRQRAALRRGYRACNRLIAVGPGLKKRVEDLSGREVLLIPNMVNQGFFEKKKEKIPCPPFRFVSVAMLSHLKGMDILLRAFARVSEQNPEVELAICGDGVEKESLSALAAELGLSGKVYFPGRLTREECSEQLCRSHAFVMASRVETFGIVYIEAMACGLPIIMAKTGAWELLARPETGLAVEIEDVDGLADAMLSLMEHYESYDSDRIIQYCRDRFSEDAVCREIEAVYEEVRRKKK